MKNESLPKLHTKLKALCIDKQGCLYYHAGDFFWSETVDQPPKFLLGANKEVKDRVLVKVRLLERLFRMEPRFAVPFEKGYLVSWNCAMYYLDLSKNTFEKLFRYRQGMHNPLSMTKIEQINGFSEGYVYGEYWGNRKKEAVDIFGIFEGEKKKMYTFPAGSIQHIHGITVDKKTGRVLICTGDADKESGIWEAFDDFIKVEPILKGKQLYRTCDAYITERGILYATDSPLMENAVYLYDENTKKVHAIFELRGPCIYSKRIEREGEGDLFVFATSVEPDSSLPKWIYKFSYSLGVGVKSRHASVVVGNPQEGFSERVLLHKDIWPMWLFQFGNVTFPWQREKDTLFFTPIATKHDGHTLKIDI